MPRSCSLHEAPSQPVAESTNEPRYRYRRRRWHALFGAIDACGTLVWRIASWFYVRSKPLPFDAVRSILVIQLDHLGDALLTTGMLGALRQRWPKARIEVLAAPWNAAVFAHAAEVDVIHVWATNRFARPLVWWWPLALLAWGWRLRNRRFDLAIDVRGELPLALLMTLCGAKRRVGWSAGGGGFLLTDSIAYRADRHELDSRRAIVAALGASVSSDVSLAPHFEPTLAERTSASSWLARRLSGNQPLVVFHIGAGTSAKRWPVGHWQELLGRVMVALDVRVALVGVAHEQSIAREILGDQAWPQVLDLTGRLSVGELAALCERAQAFVGADSGPAHLATAVGTPVVTLFSGTNRPEQWRPRGARVCVLQQPVACAPCHCSSCPLVDHPCMTGLQPARVAAELIDLLSVGSLPDQSSQVSHDRASERTPVVVAS